MSLPFRERNPIKIGAVSLAVIIGLLVVAFQAGNLPVIGSGDTYYANFTEASSLKPNNEVRMAGVRVGKVTAVDLDGDHVKVTFKVDTPARFGNLSTAEIKIKTLLGSMFLSLSPAGPGQMDEGDTIPVSRTKSAFDIVQAFTGTAERVEKINLGQLSQSLTTLADATANTPKSFQSALKGVSDLSRNVAARDEQLNTLLKNLHKVSGVLADRDDDVIQLMKDSDVLLRALVQRRESIHRLLVSTSTLSTELTGLVKQSRADLKPALADLQSVVDLLLKNQKNLDDSLRLMAPFYRVFANVLGSGPWFDTWIMNLPPV